jgi:hypothetical protein
MGSAILKEGQVPAVTTTTDATLERIYGYHGPYPLPNGVAGRIWAAPANIPAGPTQPAKYFLHYFQSQGLGPTTNECVTTSTVMSMNLAADRIASGRAKSLLYSSDLHLEDYIHELDARGFSGWKYRYATKSPLPGMMTPWQAVRALRDHAAGLKAKYSRGYAAQLSPGRTVDDLAKNLQAGRFMLIHGAWPIHLTDPKNAKLALLGGMPHTMILVGYEAAGDQWLLLNPAEPWQTARTAKPPKDLYKMTTQALMGFWGRRFVFYPPRFSITTIVPDS